MTNKISLTIVVVAVVVADYTHNVFFFNFLSLTNKIAPKDH